MSSMPSACTSLLAVSLLLAVAAGPARADGEPAFVPWPRAVALAEGKMLLGDKCRIVAQDRTLLPLARILSREVALASGLRLPAVEGTAKDGDVVLSLSPDLKGDAYRLTVGDRAVVSGAGYNAVSLGTVTLLQALHTDDGGAWLRRLTVEDGPFFPYCGAMLDVARKPYSITTLKQCVRVCRFYKIRFLQLHLSDENAWVFPSPAFPKLGSQNFAWAGGKRPEVYPLAELKELVAYADARGVTLVPEIEMPGHSGQLRGTLPEIFGYRNDAGKVVTPGVLNMVSEDAFGALDTLVGEVAEVFRSSPYIHIGCDEASVAEVEGLPEVKAFCAAHKLKGAGDVFNAFVNRMHGIVKKHGKRPIVWEGAPLGPVPPPKDLIFMPWVGGAGTAAELVRRGYAVINPPWGTKQPYFDPYLVNGAQLRRGEPLLLGATSLLWESPEERAVPFLRQTGALRNEPTYHPDSARDYADFLRRLHGTEPLLDRLLAGFTFRTEGLLDPLVMRAPNPTFDKRLTVTLATSFDPGQVHFTLDGSEPTPNSPRYEGPITLRKTTTLKARWFGPKEGEEVFTLARTYCKVPVVRHDAIGAAVTVVPEPSGGSGPGPRGLTDGFLADGEEPGSGGWLAYGPGGNPTHITMDLGQPKKLTTLGGHFLRCAGSVALPKTVVFAVSDDGKTYRDVATVPYRTGSAHRGWYSADVMEVSARYVRVSTTPGGEWTFIDEVVVNPRLEEPPLKHAALGKPVTLAHQPSEFYGLPGSQGLTDGFISPSPDCLNAEWLGLDGKDLDATIDLGRVIDVHEVGGYFLQQVQYGVHLPSSVDVLVSDDGKAFRKVGAVTGVREERPACTRSLSATLTGVRGRYVRVVAHPGGEWLFAGEVFVNPEAGGETR